MWWDKVNKAMDPDAFERLHNDFLLALGDKDSCSSPTSTAVHSPSIACGFA